MENLTKNALYISQSSQMEVMRNKIIVTLCGILLSSCATNRSEDLGTMPMESNPIDFVIPDSITKPRYRSCDEFVDEQGNTFTREELESRDE